jgi:hypothetical protein
MVTAGFAVAALVAALVGVGDELVLLVQAATTIIDATTNARYRESRILSNLQRRAPGF